MENDTVSEPYNLLTQKRESDRIRIMRIVSEENLKERLFALYEQLRSQHGALMWWPADTPFEVALGGILTQATSWRNVEKAFENLKAAGVWTPAQIRSTSQSELETLLRPSLYYRAKAKKVRAFVSHLAKRPMHVMFEQSVPELREELLSIFGIGPETADTIILYAAEKPSFVVDAYTHRLLTRLGWLEGNYHYARLRALFMEHLPHDVRLFNEYHALIVRHGARVCQKTPRCEECSLRHACAYFSDKTST